MLRGSGERHYFGSILAILVSILVLQGQAADGRQSVPARVVEHRAMVPAEPSPVGAGAVGRTRAEAAGSLRVLRDRWQHGDVAAVPARSGTALAEVAIASASAVANPVGSVQPAAGTLSVAAGAFRLGLTWRSECVTGRAGCLHRASPDLWEPWGLPPQGDPAYFPQQLVNPARDRSHASIGRSQSVAFSSHVPRKNDPGGKGRGGGLQDECALTASRFGTACPSTPSTWPSGPWSAGPGACRPCPW
jgi:hypothetical protein